MFGIFHLLMLLDVFPKRDLTTDNSLSFVLTVPAGTYYYFVLTDFPYH